ncbi:DUF1540 domain-containing protein [Neomoorella thermoacetica]|uniref:DUF1540 domain-containing protein n=1 Tax=Neomoorella thermoacetica TaxID=1525 RepID=UPI000908447A|nr:DUF1540 domain-containing protein [Moorella thermoacetica]APC07859.1 hypothetical protein MTJW_06890 [Moorella thermoacetica]
MPEVSCRVANCIYWQDGDCEAQKITIAVQGTPNTSSAVNDRSTECETFQARA